MSAYKKEVTQATKHAYWTIWKVAPIIIVIAVIGFTLKSVGLIGSKAVERQVMVNSHQYIEGMAQRAAILKANIVEIDVMIATGKGNRVELEGQKRILKSQLAAITLNQ